VLREDGGKEVVMDVGWQLPVAWVTLGIIVVACGLRASRSQRAYRVGVAAVSALWVLAGAGANAYFLARGDDFSGFADGASTSFVRDTWQSLVVPHHTVFIGLLVAFEAAAGLAVLVEGTVRQTALLLLIAFTVALLSFGWGYLVWSVPLGVALGLLWRHGRQGLRAQPHMPHGAEKAASRTA
jgi:hypothetical protein